jgi:hypothetical protein
MRAEVDDWPEELVKEQNGSISPVLRALETCAPVSAKLRWGLR